jgi:hypothetical protein
MKKFIFLTIFTGIFAGCDKSDKPVEDAQTKTCSLSSEAIVGVYKVVKVTDFTSNQSGGLSETNITNQISPNRLDDQYEFKSNSVFIWTDTGIRAPASMLTASESWKLDGKQLTPAIQGYFPNPMYYDTADEFVVSEFACDSMKIDKRFTETNDGVTLQSGLRYYLRRMK